MKTKILSAAFLILVLLFSVFNFVEAKELFRIGDLVFWGSAGTHYLGGCIQTKASHVNLGANKGSQELVNLHIAKYQKGGKSCLGIYSTGRISFCWEICWGNYWTWLYYTALALSICLTVYLIYLSWSILVWIARIALGFIF